MSSGKSIKFAAILIVVSMLQSSSLFAQNDSIRHQISFGIAPGNIDESFFNAEYKTFFKKRMYYNFCAEGFYRFSNENQFGENLINYQIASSASIGVYYNFFKILRFNMGAQLTSFVAKHKGTHISTPPENFDYERKRQGIFIGPEFALEVRAFRFKSSEISVFAKIHTGFGYMHESYYNNNPKFTYESDDSYEEWYGMDFIGVSFRF